MEEVIKKRTHHGHAIQRVRQCHNWSRATLAEKMCMEQQAIYRIEKKQQIDEETLAKFAKVLNVSVEFLKEMEEEQPITNYFINNTFSPTDSNMPIGSTIEKNSMTINSNKEHILALEELKKVYEENVLVYKELIAELRKEIAKLEEENKQLRDLLKD